MLNLLKKLSNPYLLVGQGFLVGAAIFLATHDAPADPSVSGPVAQASFLDRMMERL